MAAPHVAQFWQQRTNFWRKVTSPRPGSKRLRNGSAKRSGIRRLVRAARRRFHETMTLQEAKSIARHLRLTLRHVCSGAYRVNFRDGNETTAYYTDNLEDAVKTAVAMARKRSGITGTPGDCHTGLRSRE